MTLSYRRPQERSSLVIDKREWRIVCILAALAWLVHGLMLEAPVVIGEPFMVAESIVRGEGFSSIYPFASGPQLHNYIPPFYAYLLAGALEVGASVRSIQWLELAFLALAYLPIYSLFRPSLGRCASLLGLTLLTVYLPLWKLAACIDPNALNVLLLSLTLERAYHYTNTLASRWTLALILAVQLVLRPDVLLFIPLLLFWLARNRSASWWKTVPYWVGAGIVATLPFALRNYHVFGRYLPLSSNGGYNLFIGNNPDATGEYTQLADDPVRYGEWRMLARSMSQPELDDAFRERAISWIKDHPTEALQLAITKLWYHWWHDPSLEDRSGQGAVLAFDIATVLLLLLSIICVLRMRDTALRSLILLVFLYSSVIAMLFFSQTRFRLIKVDPIMIMLSAEALSALFGRLRHGSRILPLPEV